MQGQYLSILVDLSTQHLGTWDSVHYFIAVAVE